MATVQSILDRVRLEIADTPTPFISHAVGDGRTTIYDLPAAPVTSAGLSVLVDAQQASNYTLDPKSGSISFATAPVDGAEIQVMGTGYRFFTDGELTTFITTATSQHLHNRNLTLTTMPPVEDYLLALLASIEALYALLNDASYDIDVNTPEGVSIPRRQRVQQIMQMIQLREKQYSDLASALNVGLNRVEQFTLRRVSRTTNRLVPVYKPREIEDSSPPQRVFLPIDSQGGTNVPDPVEPATLDITFRQGNTFDLPLDFSFDLTGFTVYASIRRYPESARIRDFTVTYTDASQGQVTLSLTSNDTRVLARQLFWDCYLRDPSGNERPYLAGRVEVDRGRVALSQTYGS